MEQEAHRHSEGSHSREPRKRSQETKAILAATTSIIVLLLGLLVTNLHTSARIEARIDRMSARIEARIDRVSARTETRIDQVSASTEARLDQVSASTEARLDQMQAEARSDRAAWQAETRASRAEVKANREDFQRQILRLTEVQVRTAAVVEQIRTTSRLGSQAAP